MARKITLPLTEELAKTLKAGDELLVTGVIYTSRDAGNKRMCENLAAGALKNLNKYNYMRKR